MDDALGPSHYKPPSYSERGAHMLEIAFTNGTRVIDKEPGEHSDEPFTEATNIGDPA